MLIMSHVTNKNYEFAYFNLKTFCIYNVTCD